MAEGWDVGFYPMVLYISLKTLPPKLGTQCQRSAYAPVGSRLAPRSLAGRE